MTKTVGDNSVNASQLKSFVDRLEKLDEEKQGVLDDIKDVKNEAKDKGLDVKTLDRILKMRKQDAEMRRAEREMLDAYLVALGMV